jgi:integrase/recombinase XerD
VPVQPLVSGASGRRSYTVLGRDDRPVAPVEAFLAHLDRLTYSPNTIKAYAHDLQDLFAWLDGCGRDWWSLQSGDVGEWIAWLRVPKHLRDAGVLVFPTVENAMSERTLQRKLAAVSAFYDFHRHSDPRVELTLSRWSAGSRPGGFKGFRHSPGRGGCQPLPGV